MKPGQKILIINAGSATLKFKIFSANLTEEISGVVERLDLTDSFLELKSRGSKNFVRRNFPGGVKDQIEALEAVFLQLKDYLPQVGLIGHRVVHGGEEFTQTTRLNSLVVEKLKKYNKLAPLHNPANLMAAARTLKKFPAVDQYAVFDTAYYKTLPEHIYRYALPNEFYEKEKIRVYGFHGVSHQYAVLEGAKKAKKSLKNLRVVSCHLGSGCSVTASLAGEALATSMGFTPLSGVMMSSRAGDLDPGILLYLLEELKLDAAAIRNILNRQSGLLAVAGVVDMRDILLAAGQKVEDYEAKKQFTISERERARLALKMFIYHLTSYIGQYFVLLGGLDLLVFTGGIGERSNVIRQLVKKQVSHLGKFKVAVVPANEELMIAREILKVIK